MGYVLDDDQRTRRALLLMRPPAAVVIAVVITVLFVALSEPAAGAVVAGIFSGVVGLLVTFSRRLGRTRTRRVINNGTPRIGRR